MYTYMNTGVRGLKLENKLSFSVYALFCMSSVLAFFVAFGIHLQTCIYIYTYVPYIQATHGCENAFCFVPYVSTPQQVGSGRGGNCIGRRFLERIRSASVLHALRGHFTKETSCVSMLEFRTVV
jgi:hypothetical protein